MTYASRAYILSTLQQRIEESDIHQPTTHTYRNAVMLVPVVKACIPTLPVVCYYFFSQEVNRKASRIKAYRALATQVFQQCEHLEEIHSIFGIANDGMHIKASEHELLDLLKICLPLLSNVSFILDGIDECDDSTKLLRELCNLSFSSRLKTALLSRPNVACLRRSVQVSRTICMCRSTLDIDIALYLDGEIAALQESSLVPEDVSMSSLRDKMLLRADGMFLWARLMMRYLNSPALTRAERVEEITKTTPEGLDDMYEKIFNHIKSMDRASRQLASRVFMWVGYAQSNLTPLMIKEVVWVVDTDMSGPDQLDDIDHAIIVSCCGLIEKRQNMTLHFIHLTAQESVLSSRFSLDTGSSFVLLDTEAAVEITKRCISYLMVSIPGRPLSRDIHKSIHLDDLYVQHPFLLYAARHWMEHIKQAAQGFDKFSASKYTYYDDLIEILEQFLRMNLNLMVWVEAIYTIKVNTWIDTLSNAARILQLGASHFAGQRRAADELSDFAMDMKNLDIAWKETLLQSPHEIWNDVTVFTPSRFFVRTSAASLEPLAPKRTTSSDSGITPLFSMSSSSLDGHQIASLSIYPSQ